MTTRLQQLIRELEELRPAEQERFVEPTPLPPSPRRGERLLLPFPRREGAGG